MEHGQPSNAKNIAFGRHIVKENPPFFRGGRFGGCLQKNPPIFLDFSEKFVILTCSDFSDGDKR